jgi:hypothetical protein
MRMSVMLYIYDFFQAIGNANAGINDTRICTYHHQHFPCHVLVLSQSRTSAVAMRKRLIWTGQYPAPDARCRISVVGAAMSRYCVLITMIHTHA